YWALVPPAMLLLEVGLLALQVWLLGRLEPMRQINSFVGAAPRPEPAQRETPPATAPHGRGVPGQLGPAPLLARRHRLGSASANYALFKLLGGGFRGLLHRLAVPGMVLVLVLVLASGNADLWMWMLFLSFLTFGTFANGSELPVGDPERLYLLGVDYRCQLV